MTLIGHEAVGQKLRARLAYFSASPNPTRESTLPPLLRDVMYFNGVISEADYALVSSPERAHCGGLHSPIVGDPGTTFRTAHDSIHGSSTAQATTFQPVPSLVHNNRRAGDSSCP